MVFRVAVCLVLASAIAAAQPRIERGTNTRVPGGRISQLLAEPELRGSVIPVNGRRTTIVRISDTLDAESRGFSASQLASFGIFAGPGTVANAIVGFTRDSAANLLVDAPIQLRNLTMGSVVGQTRTNMGGQFAFPTLPSGTYIVELLNARGMVVALSDAVSLGSGEIVQTVVQMSAPTRSFAAWIGGATSTAVNAAVHAGVLAVQPAAAVTPES